MAFLRTRIIFPFFVKDQYTNTFFFFFSVGIGPTPYGHRRYNARDGDIVIANPVYDWDGIRDNEPAVMELAELRQRDVDVHNPNFNPVVGYQSVDEAHGRSDNVCVLVDFMQSNQAEV